MLIEPTVIIIILAFSALFSLSMPLSLPLIILNALLIFIFFKKIKKSINHHEFTIQLSSALIVSLIFMLYNEGTSTIIRTVSALGIIELAQFLIFTYFMSKIIKSVYTLIYPKSKDINSHASHAEHH